MPINISQITSNTTQTKSAGEQKNVINLDKNTKGGTQTSGKATLSPDSINLTESATRIKALEEQVARLPIVDTNKIEQIKNSIDEGSYEVNPERIAEKMIQLEKELQR
ncbi:MAG: flagellar biosynthesis anti-sigma factor FlgM [gamma proteobacterium symbiont of Taylorina sp.]|nr:flagellar biosynthesis anti-sigma factor FlgM [gamma proteobacterium symbiont of Taylorina sp.]